MTDTTIEWSGLWQGWRLCSDKVI